MAAGRTSVPPVNLKDRIAALQQRNVSPASQSSESSPLVPTVPGRLTVGSLKDKIANFERAGAVPTPKGRFGSSAPVAADGAPRKRGELYGNRVPGLAKPSVDASLLVRKRTVSSSDAPSHLRPTSPEVPPVPPLVPSLTGGSVNLGSLHTLSPFPDKPAARRVVSDLFPGKSSTFLTDPVAKEEVEEEVATQKEPEPTTDTLVDAEPDTQAEVTSNTSHAPAALQVEDTSVTLDGSATTQVEELEVSPVASSPGVTDDDKSEVGTIKVEDTTPPATSLKVDISEPVDTTGQVAKTELPSANDVEVSPTVIQTVEKIAAVAEDLTGNTESDDVSVLGGSTASSESVLNTPSDRATFPTTGTSAEAKEILAEDKGTFTPSTPAVVAPDAVSSSPLSSIPSGLRNSLNTRHSVLSQISIGGESLALDAKDAIIITEPPHIVSPTLTRATIVPAPTAVSARSQIPSPPPVSATEQAVLERRITQKSFRAVVHHKVRETSTSESVPPAVVAPRHAPSLPPPQTPVTRRIRSEALVEPQSPGFGDLVALMADAALLEEQLSSSRSPAKKVLPNPTLNVQAPIPEPKPTEAALPSTPQHLSPVVHVSSQSQEPSPSSDASHSVQMPGGPLPLNTTHVRARTTSDHPSSPPRNNGRHFSSLRVRKESMPGAYPRSSVCSEVSEDSSVLVSRPPSPPMLAYDRSDASSVRSSTKSWKSPKKGLGRASSWLFRGKSKNQAVMEEQDAHLDVSEHPLPSPSLLSPVPPTPPPKSPAGRPASWMSASSGASGDIFDAELFDAFPSVPGGVTNRVTSMHYPNATQLPSQQRGQGLAPRPHTMYGAPRK